MMKRERLSKSHAAVTGGGSALGRYQSTIVGRPGLLALFYYEFCVWLGLVPGALGIVLRRIFWGRLFAACGNTVYFGANITLMHPHRITIGDRTVISNGCILDARNPASEVAIRIGSDVILSQNVMLSCKNAEIDLGSRIGIGPYTVVQSSAGDSVEIGDDAVIAAHCYIGGGGAYRMERLDIPIAQQPMRPTGGTRVGEGAWLGANVTVLGGATIGRDSAVGAGAVVARSLPERAVCAGVPARVLRRRDEEKTEIDEIRAS